MIDECAQHFIEVEVGCFKTVNADRILPRWRFGSDSILPIWINNRLRVRYTNMKVVTDLVPQRNTTIFRNCVSKKQLRKRARKTTTCALCKYSQACNSIKLTKLSRHSLEFFLSQSTSWWSLCVCTCICMMNAFPSVFQSAVNGINTPETPEIVKRENTHRGRFTGATGQDMVTVQPCANGLPNQGPESAHSLSFSIVNCRFFLLAPKQFWYWKPGL